MRSAVIVSTARTPIGRAYRGAFNDTPAQTLGGHAIAQCGEARRNRAGRGRGRGHGCCACSRGSRAPTSRGNARCAPACR